jgi:uncharacterized protein YecE (DUF72 family)
MLKDFSNLLVARITKKEMLSKRPEALNEFEAEGKKYYVLKEEWFENFKKVLRDILLERAVRQKYYLYSEIVYRETADALYAVALAYPRWVGFIGRLLRLPLITTEEFVKKALEKINEFEFKPVYVEEFQNPQQNAKQV